MHHVNHGMNIWVGVVVLIILLIIYVVTNLWERRDPDTEEELNDRRNW